MFPRTLLLRTRIHMTKILSSFIVGYASHTFEPYSVVNRFATTREAMSCLSKCVLQESYLNWIKLNIYYFHYSIFVFT